MTINIFHKGARIAAGAALALCAITSAAEAQLIAGVAYEWGEEAEEGVDFTRSNWNGRTAIDIFLANGPYLGFGFSGAPNVSLEVNDVDLGNDSRVITLSAALGYSFNNWTPFVEMSRTRFTPDVLGVEGEDDWLDPTYALGTWIRSSETTRFRLAVSGLEADDPYVGIMTGFYARPAAARRFVVWGDIGYVPKLSGVSFGVGIGVKLGKMGR